MSEETWLVMCYTQGIEGVEEPKWIVFDHHSLEDAKKVFNILKHARSYQVVTLAKIIEESRKNQEVRKDG